MHTICRVILLAVSISPATLSAEPYFAVREGHACSTCHVNPTGGGMRNAFGNTWAAESLAARKLDSDLANWAGALNEWVAVGGNLRSNANYTNVPNQDDQFEFALEEIRVYLDVNPVPGRIGAYVDQRVGPGGSINREAYARYWAESGNWYVKAGQMYLPYGLRLEDDTAFIRQAPGINMNTPDRGVEFGWERFPWSLQFAVTNGTGGGFEIDRGKQYSLRAEYIDPAWRAGASVNHNDTALGSRQMQNVFAGVRTGNIAWLAEYDWVRDDSLFPSLSLRVVLLEANWLIARGHNLKLTAEHFDPDNNVSGDTQARYSAVWEYTPFQFIQLRAGARYHDGPGVFDLLNRRIMFMQLHSFF